MRLSLAPEAVWKRLGRQLTCPTSVWKRPELSQSVGTVATRSVTSQVMIIARPAGRTPSRSAGMPAIVGAELSMAKGPPKTTKNLTRTTQAPMPGSRLAASTRYPRNLDRTRLLLPETTRRRGYSRHRADLIVEVSGGRCTSASAREYDFACPRTCRLRNRPQRKQYCQLH